MSKDLNRRTVLAGAAALTPTAAIGLPALRDDAELLTLGAKLDGIQKECVALRALDRADRDAHEAKVKAITGVARRDAPVYSKDDPTGYWTISEAVPYEHYDPELSGWAEIGDRMFPLCEDILARTAHTPGGLAVQVRAITMAAGELWDTDLPD